MSSYNRRKVINGSERHNNKKGPASIKKNKQFKNFTNMVKKKLDHLAARRLLKNIKVVANENCYSWSIVNGDEICLFKILLMDKSYSVWDRLYGDKWFDTRSLNVSNLDEAINYFEGRRKFS